MIPIRDDNPTVRTPVITIALLVAIGAAWLFLQGAGFDHVLLASSICNWGMVPGELTGRAALGAAVPIGPGHVCVVDAESINILTPLTSMFLHGSWAHVLGNGLFLWIFGNNVEDAMGRLRFVVFYTVCGLAAAGAQVFVSPDSAVPMVGASGAISGVLGGYLVLYPRVKVHIFVFFLFFFDVITVPAWLMLGYWFGLQLLSGLPQLSAGSSDVSSGVAFWAHIGGFGSGVALIKLFARDELIHRRRFHWRQRRDAA